LPLQAKFFEQANSVINLDPRDLLGKWKSATFHFNRLGRTGSLTDTSVVYLISSSPFEQSL
jgi:nitrate reductase alpha subunit